MEPSCAWHRSNPNRVGGNIVLSQNMRPGTLYYFIAFYRFHALTGICAYARGGVIYQAHFPRLLSFILTTLLKSFNCHRVATSPRSHSDPLLRMRRRSALSLLSGAGVELRCMMCGLGIIWAWYTKSVRVSPRLRSGLCFHLAFGDVNLVSARALPFPVGQMLWECGLRGI